MKSIKFRSWNNRDKVMEFPDHIANGIDGEKYQIMQFTGLLDKQGKEIYEGDIVQVAHDAYQSPICIISIRNLIAGDYSLDESEVSESEVIGNIYSNPELLKES